jgi:hypothetical protein
MKSILLILIAFNSYHIFSQNNRIWIHYYNNINSDIKRMESRPFQNPRLKNYRNSLRIELEKTFIGKNKDFQIGLSGVFLRNKEMLYYSHFGIGGFNGRRFLIGGGGVNIRKKIITDQFVSLWISNTNNILHMNHGDLIGFRYKTKYKNFIENNLSIEGLFKIKNKLHINSRISYNLRWDLKYPEPYNENFMIQSPFLFSLGIAF